MPVTRVNSRAFHWRSTSSARSPTSMSVRASPVLAFSAQPHGSDLAVHVLPAESGDLALAHARDEGEADKVLQPLGQVRHDGVQLPPDREALPGILFL